jgi:hypothetical protein
VPDTSALPETLDSVLRKYGKIWIWSILCTAAAAFTVRGLSAGLGLQLSMMNNASSHLPASTLFPALTMLVGPAAALVAVWYLLQFLHHHILPILFPPPSTFVVPRPAPEALSNPPQHFTMTGAPVIDHAAAPEPPAEIVLPAPPDGARLLYMAFVWVVLAVAIEPVIGFVSLLYRAFL